MQCYCYSPIVSHSNRDGGGASLYLVILYIYFFLPAPTDLTLLSPQAVLHSPQPFPLILHSYPYPSRFSLFIILK